MPRIGFFTRLLDEGTAAQRYGWALEQIQQAERAGFATAWIAQHHFNADEGGLPSPWPFLGAAAQATERIRLGTAVVTLPHENAVRTAEDAAVVDVLSGGRFEFGIAPGASAENLDALGYTNTNARELFNEKLPVLRAALAGKPLGDAGMVLQPLAEGLNERMWQATFSTNGATRAGQAGDGLMLSRIQPGSEVGEAGRRPANAARSRPTALNLPTTSHPAYWLRVPPSSLTKKIVRLPCNTCVPG